MFLGTMAERLRGMKTFRLARLIVLTCLAEAALLEVLARLLLASPPTLPYKEHPILNHVWLPHTTYIHREWEGAGIPAFPLRSNGQSLLLDYELSERSEKRRIFFLGDSFVEGTAPLEDSYVAVVGEKVESRHPVSYEFINSGTASYSPLLYYLLFTTKLAHLSPSVIVVTVDMTDVFDDNLYRKNCTFDNAGLPLACPPNKQLRSGAKRTEKGLEILSVRERIGAFLIDNSRVVREIHRIIANLNYIPPEDTPELFAWCRQEWGEEVQAQVDFSLKTLKQLIEVAKTRGVTVVLTAVPHRKQLLGKWSERPFQVLSELARREGIDFIDPIPEIKKRCEKKESCINQLYIAGDMHFNREGYRVWGATVGEELAKLLMTTR